MIVVKKMISIIAAALMTVSLLTVFACAATPSEARDSVVWIQSEFVYTDGTYTITLRACGSGFAIGRPGDSVSNIVTNAHVVVDDYGNKANKVTVYFSKAANRYMEAQIYKLDTVKDICVLRLPEPTTERKAMVLCKSNDVDLDDSFAALGYPGVATENIDFVAYDQKDIVITKGGITKGQSMNADGVNVYMIDLEISNGNSGGPLVNSKGEVVGINTYAMFDGSAQANYAVSIDELVSMIDRESVPYVLSTDTHINVTLIIIIAASAVVVAAGVIVVIAVMRRNKTAAPANVNAAYPAPSSGAILRCEKGALAGRSYMIGDCIVIGRNPEKCGISLPVDTQGISGVHCEIRRCANGYEIIDRGSTYGTSLGTGQKLTPNVPVLLVDGTYFFLGSPDQLFQIRYQ